MPVELTLSTGEVTASGLVFVWSLLQSFGLEYIPGVRVWFDTKEPGIKKSVNAAGLGVVAGGLYLLSLAGVVDAFTPDLNGFVVALGAYFLSLGIQYGVHAQTKRV